MFSCSIFGRDVCLQGSPLTLVEYNKEFGGDLIQDIVSAYSSGLVNGAELLKVAWAMAKTHDPKTQPFNDWIKNFDPEEFNLLDMEVWEVINSAINAELFRGQATIKRKFRRKYKR